MSDERPPGRNSGTVIGGCLRPVPVDRARVGTWLPLTPAMALFASAREHYRGQLWRGIVMGAAINGAGRTTRVAFGLMLDRLADSWQMVTIDQNW